MDDEGKQYVDFGEDLGYEKCSRTQSEPVTTHYEVIQGRVHTLPEPPVVVVVNTRLHDNISAAMAARGIDAEQLLNRTVGRRKGATQDTIARAMAGLSTQHAPLDAIGEVLGVSRIDLVLMPTRKLNRQMQRQRWAMRARTLFRGGMKP